MNAIYTIIFQFLQRQFNVDKREVKFIFVIELIVQLIYTFVLKYKECMLIISVV